MKEYAYANMAMAPEIPRFYIQWENNFLPALQQTGMYLYIKLYKLSLPRFI